MKLLFDENISYRILKKIAKYFPECGHVESLLAPSKKDIDIWNYAREQNFCIVSFDSDFFDLSLNKRNST